tara:strand:- start:2305 stop:2622 length:318 start_codon:yes stop_codon:yes gene_type:complete
MFDVRFTGQFANNFPFCSDNKLFHCGRFLGVRRELKKTTVVVNGRHGVSAIIQLHEEASHLDMGLRRLDDPSRDREKFVESFFLVPLAKMSSPTIVGAIVFLDVG